MDAVKVVIRKSKGGPGSGHWGHGGLPGSQGGSTPGKGSGGSASGGTSSVGSVASTLSKVLETATGKKPMLRGDAVSTEFTAGKSKFDALHNAISKLGYYEVPKGGGGRTSMMSRLYRKKGSRIEIEVEGRTSGNSDTWHIYDIGHESD